MAKETEIGKLVLRLVADVKEIKKGLNEGKKLVDDFAKAGKKGHRDFESSLAGIKAGYLKVAAAAYVAYRTVIKAMEWAKEGARAQAIDASFERLTKSMGVNGAKLIEEMQEVAMVWVDTTDVMVKAQRLLVEGVSPKEIINLTRSARVASKLMAIDVSTAFDMVSEAVLKMQTRGIKAAFPMDVTKVVDDYARSIGTVNRYLLESGQRQAILNEITRQTTEKLKLLGDSMYPDNYDKVQKFFSRLDVAKEFLGRELVNAIMATTDALGVLYEPIKKIIDAISWLKDTIKGVKPPKFEDYTQLGLESSRGLVGGQAQVQKELEDDSKRRRAVVENEAAQVGKISKKSQIDQIKLSEDLMKFRLANAEQMATAVGSIEKYALEKRKIEEMTALERRGADTALLALEWDRKIAQVSYENELVTLRARRDAEVENARQTAMDVQNVRDKYSILESEARAKHVAEMADIDGRIQLSFENIYGMTESELKSRLDASRLAKEGLYDRWRTEANIEALNEERKRNEVVKLQIAESQYQLSKEERLGREIELTNELLMNAQRRLSYLSQEDDEYIAAYQEVETYKNKINELTYSLKQQTATFDELMVTGMKKYAAELKDNLINSMENLLPRTIDTAGDAFKMMFKNVANGTKSAGEAFKEFAQNIAESVTDMLIDIALLIAKMELLKALGYGQQTGTQTTGGGGYGWIASLASMIVSFFQTGGPIKGPGGVDRVPVMATAGEYMHPVPTVRYYGLDVMEKIRSKSIPRDALLALASGLPSLHRTNTSLAMQMGGIVPINSQKEPVEKKEDIVLINVNDPREMDTWAASSRGQHAILNVLSSRAETVRKIIR
jgi:hypothetical protein